MLVVAHWVINGVATVATVGEMAEMPSCVGALRLVRDGLGAFFQSMHDAVERRM
jgi:hypothetical protein